MIAEISADEALETIQRRFPYWSNILIERTAFAVVVSVDALGGHTEGSRFRGEGFSIAHALMNVEERK